ncbi:hypothetical protein, partial [Ensifer aridi]|uniref:hypothetical protein n=1 Tax=Ensifer aridi TaxID=1708715 RepID=UPI001AECD093
MSGGIDKPVIVDAINRFRVLANAGAASAARAGDAQMTAGPLVFLCPDELEQIRIDHIGMRRDRVPSGG